MKDPLDVERRYVVGRVTDARGLERRIKPLGATIRHAWAAQAGHVVLVDTTARYAGEIAESLGPNAQIIEDDAEARRAAEAAAQERPYESREAS